MGKILKFLSPQIATGGLEIGDSYLRFVLIKEKKVDFFSLKLPPGIMENGKVKNKESLEQMLLNLHAKISSKSKKIYTVLSVSDSNVYTSLLSLPSIASGSLEEAARLNLQMASPVDFNTVYSDWQLIGQKESNAGNQLEIFGVFAPRQTIDEFESVLEKAGFIISAIEFPAISLSRVLMRLGEGIEKQKTYIILRVGGDGLTYGIVKNGNLYFVHFISWASAYGQDKKIDKNSLANLIVAETRKVLNFHDNHVGGQIEKILIVSPTMIDDIIKTLSSELPLVKSEVFSLSQFKELSVSWLSVLGVALRGIIPRSEDSIITLASIDTDVKFGNWQTMRFIRTWIYISFSVLFFILVFSAAINYFLGAELKNLKSQPGDLSSGQNSQKIAELSRQAGEFNRKAELISSAYANQSHWAAVFEDIFSKLTTGMSINRFYFPAPESPVLLSGTAPGEDAILAFRDQLQNDPRFSNIELPLSSIKPASSKFSFSMTFNVKQ